MTDEEVQASLARISMELKRINARQEQELTQNAQHLRHLQNENRRIKLGYQHCCEFLDGLRGAWEVDLEEAGNYLANHLEDMAEHTPRASIS